MRALIAIIIYSSICIQLNAQTYHNIDSLWIEYNNASHDTSRIIILNEKIGYIYESIDLDSAIFYYKKAVKLVDKNTAGKDALYEKYMSLKARSLGYIGNVYELQSVYEKSLSSYLNSLKIYEDLLQSKDPSMVNEAKSGIAKSYGNIGNSHLNQSNYENAIEYLLIAVEKFSEIEEKANTARCINNIGKAYYLQNNYEKSIEYNLKASEIFKEIGDKKGMSACYTNMGSYYHIYGDFEKAIEYYLKSLKIKQELNDENGIAIVYGNISALYSAYADSLGYNKKLKQANLDSALLYGQKAMTLAEHLNSVSAINRAASKLKNVYVKLGNYEEAIKYAQIYIATQDSMFNADKTKALADMSTKYESEKKQLEIDKMQKAKELDNKIIEAQQAENRKQLIIIIASVIGFIIVLVFSIILFRMFSQKRKANIMLARQKEEIEEKNKDILDSITYARRIQSAILPPMKIVKEYLKESFILYKPKDIVAGDFYWMEHKDGKVLFAVADCTGHGVPGALVSVICNNGLNRSVREHGLTDPGKILDKTREIVIQEFEKSEEDVKDGMDIALCSLSGNILQYAGAHNPLWIVRNGEILETRADNQPIGVSRISRSFSTHSIELHPDDSIYIFSDGYIDQFGGENGKKFKSKAFKELLLSIQDKKMEEQKLILNNNFENWRGKLEQIDDVCVIGVKI